MYIYNHKNWLSLENSYFGFKKKETKKEVIKEKPKRTEEERRKEIENIRAYTSNKVNSELWHNHDKAIDEVFKKGIVKSNIKVYGRFRSFLMDYKSKIIYFLLSYLCFAILIISILLFEYIPSFILNLVLGASLGFAFLFSYCGVES